MGHRVAVAGTVSPGTTTYALNYGVGYGDPLGGALLRAGGVSAVGAEGFLARC